MPDPSQPESGLRLPNMDYTVSTSDRIKCPHSVQLIQRRRACSLSAGQCPLGLHKVMIPAGQLLNLIRIDYNGPTFQGPTVDDPQPPQ